MPLHVSGTVVLIIRRLKLYYTEPGIVTFCRWPSGAQVQRGLSQPVHRTVVFIIRRSKFYYTAPGIVTPVGGRPVHSPLSTCAPDGHLQNVTIPDAV